MATRSRRRANAAAKSRAAAGRDTASKLTVGANRFEADAGRIAARIPASYPPNGDRAVAMAFAHRGIALWRGQQHALRGPSIASARSTLRVLAELPITVAWLWLRPELHLDLWQAEFARNQVAIYRGMPGTWAAQLLESTAVADHRRAFYQREVDRVNGLLAAAADAGKPVEGLRNGFLPSTAAQVQQLVKSGRGGYRDTYELSFRHASFWVHSSGGSFLRPVDDGGGNMHNDERPPADGAYDRLESIGYLLSLLSLVDEIAELGIGDECRAVLDRLYAFTVDYAADFRARIDRSDPWGPLKPA